MMVVINHGVVLITSSLPAPHEEGSEVGAETNEPGDKGWEDRWTWNEGGG